tara:strand:- start:1478 stop:3274 length:1797 start_codon:yes stop_codon:yes gene_type:complete
MAKKVIEEGKGNQGTFGRSLMKFVQSRLPYQSYETLDTLSEVNPKYKLFQHQGSNREDALQRQSISSSTTINNNAIGDIAMDKGFQEFMYANIQQDKGARIRDYRVMAAFAEVGDALDEICDEIINTDHEGRIVRLNFRDREFKPHEQKEIQGEFQKFVQYFDLEHKGWEYFRSLLTEGELYWEHVIHKDHPKEGILGVVNIPTELIDPIFGNIQNSIVQGYLLRKPVFNESNPTKIEDMQLIPMDKNQVTYINSGIWNDNKTIRLPFLENARRAYRQLSLIEDAIVIYRLVRAPEKLVFNVDVGNMSPPKAEAYLRNLQQKYWSRHTYDTDGDGTVQKFSPQSMLDSFWFAKRAGSEGTSVNTLAGGQNLGELEDLMYFLKKLYKSLKVPVTRLNPEQAFQDGTEILREELKFARFIIRMQSHFAEGLKNGFITHLKLKKIWEKFNLKEMQLNLEFNVPTNFFEMREQQKLELRSNNYNNLAANEFVSNTWAQKRYLDWTDIEVKSNREFLRKDKELQWELMQIEQAGPNWREQMTNVAGEEAAGGGEMGGLGGAGSAIPNPQTPPEFGPPPEGGDPMVTGGEGDVPVDLGAEAGVT